MTSKSIDRDQHQREQLLVGKDRRQIHTRHRQTDDVVYLEDGRKEAYDRSELACIVPDCDVPITLVQGDRRLHYRHPKHMEDHAAGVQELHAIAYALRDWARRRGFPETALQHDPTGITVSVAKGSRVTAEYRVVTRKVSTTKMPMSSTSSQWFIWGGLIGEVSVGGEMRLPRFVRSLLERGQRVLIVSPDEGLVGTLKREGATDYQPTGAASKCLVEARTLDECSLDENGFMVTPTMQRQAAGQKEFERRREAREHEAQASREREAQVRRNSQRDAPIVREPMGVWPVAAASGVSVSTTVERRKPAPLYWNAQQSWESSNACQAAHEKFGDTLPLWLTDSTDAERDLDVVPAHWHSDLYFKDLLNANKPLSSVTLADRLSNRRWPEKVAELLKTSDLVPSYLDRLVQEGVVRRTGKGRYEAVRNTRKRRAK